MVCRMQFNLEAVAPEVERMLAADEVEEFNLLLELEGFRLPEFCLCA